MNYFDTKSLVGTFAKTHLIIKSSGHEKFDVLKEIRWDGPGLRGAAGRASLFLVDWCCHKFA